VTHNSEPCRQQKQKAWDYYLGLSQMYEDLAKAANKQVEKAVIDALDRESGFEIANMYRKLGTEYRHQAEYYRILAYHRPDDD